MNIEQRFWSKVTKTKTCWVWEACKNRYGYGDFSVNGKVVKAHRFSYEILKGSIPENTTLDHACRVRHCVNPAHLEPVTSKINVLRGIGITAENKRKTHCKRGHKFTPQNTRIRPCGRRLCRECCRAWRKDVDGKYFR